MVRMQVQLTEEQMHDVSRQLGEILNEEL